MGWERLGLGVSKGNGEEGREVRGQNTDQMRRWGKEGRLGLTGNETVLQSLCGRTGVEGRQI